MAITSIRGKQIVDGSVQRADVDTTTVGQSLVAKIIQGSNIALSSTGADAGTGDVTVSALGTSTTTTASFTVPNVASTTTVTVNDASWVTLGQLVYVANAAGAGLAGALQVTNIAGNTLTLLNPAAPPAIPPASTSTAGLLNQLSGNVGDYVGGDNACHTIASISAFVSKIAAYTLTSADSGKYIICSGGSWTLTLPAPAVGLSYRLRNDMGISGTTGTITLTPNTGTIDGAASVPLLPQQECTIITDGTNWRTHGLKREVILGTLDIITSTAVGSVLLPVGYRYFELRFTGIIPVTATDYLMGRLSFNGGSTFQGSGHYHAEFYNASATGVGYSNTENDSSFVIASRSPTTMPVQSILTLYPGSASIFPSWLVDSSGRTTATPTTDKRNGSGFYNGVGPVNAFAYLMSTGNIANCFLMVKGVV